MFYIFTMQILCRKVPKSIKRAQCFLCLVMWVKMLTLFCFYNSFRIIENWKHDLLTRLIWLKIEIEIKSSFGLSESIWRLSVIDISYALSLKVSEINFINNISYVLSTMAKHETQPKRSCHLDFLAKTSVRNQDKMIAYIFETILWGS